MILLLFNIDNLKQLRIIDEDSVSDFESVLKVAIENLGVNYEREVINDSICYFLDIALSGNEGEKFFSSNIANVIRELSEFLKEREDTFFGFSIVVTILGEIKRNFVEKLNRNLGRLEESNVVLIDERLFPLFGPYVKSFANLTIENIRFICFKSITEISSEGNLSGLRVSEKEEESFFFPEWKSIPHWIRRREIERVIDAIIPRFNWTNKEQIPYVFGFKGVGKTEIVIEALKTLLGKDNANEYIRLFVSIRGSSPLHPFINGIRNHLYRGDGEELKGIERKIWREKEELFYSICNSLVGKISPDFVLEDFMSAFHLYLLNYVRMMEKKNLPAILICDDIELYHPSSRKFLRFILRDFIELEYFIPIIVTSDKVILEEFEEFNVKKVYIPPLSWGSINELKQEIAWGNNLAEKEIKKLRRITGGLVVPSFHCLLFFKSVERSEWNNYDCRNFNFLSWFLSGLNNEKRDKLIDVLASIGLSYPFLSLEEQISFVVTLGYKESEVRSTVSFLKNIGLVSVRGKIEPFGTEVLSTIERIYRERYKNIEDLFASYLLTMYEKGIYSNFILLYYFFTKIGREEIARELYVKILERKLAERDFSGVELFLQDKFVDSLRITAVEKRVLVGFYSVVNLFLKGRYKKAYELYRGLLEFVDQISENSFLYALMEGKFASVIARLKMSLNMVDDSLSTAKRVLMFFQHIGDTCREIEVYNTIGFNMLSRGRIDEALDYFSMARHVRCEENIIDKIESFVASGIACFIDGDLFKAKNFMDEAFSLSRDTYSREWELFSLFFIARVEFELGNYSKSIDSMEKLLAYDSVYHIPGAKIVFYSWLGRALSYTGDFNEAFRIFSSLEESGDETLESKFFNAEALYFSFEYSGAVEELLDISSSVSKRLGAYKYLPGQRVVWVDGFYNIEGRVKHLAETFIGRLTGAFLAYLYSLVGKYENSVEFFREMIKGEKIPPYDPYLSLYYFLYSESLKGASTRMMSEWLVDDRFTILNRAWKTLRERSNKIGDFKYRKDYLEKNYWNSKIIERAKESNLF